MLKVPHAAEDTPLCHLLSCFVLFVVRAVNIYFILFPPYQQREGGGWGGSSQTSSFCSLFSVEQTAGGIGHRV